MANDYVVRLYLDGVSRNAYAVAGSSTSLDRDVGSANGLRSPSLMMPATLNTTIRGPPASHASRKLPAPRSFRFVTTKRDRRGLRGCTCRPLGRQERRGLAPAEDRQASPPRDVRLSLGLPFLDRRQSPVPSRVRPFSHRFRFCLPRAESRSICVGIVHRRSIQDRTQAKPPSLRRIANRAFAGTVALGTSSFLLVSLLSSLCFSVS